MATDDTINKVVAHYNALGLQSCHIPEWGEDGTTAYWKPITIKDRANFRQNIADMGELEAFAVLVINKASDEDGNRLFSVKHMGQLTGEAVAEPVERLALKMLGVYNETLAMELANEVRTKQQAEAELLFAYELAAKIHKPAEYVINEMPLWEFKQWRALLDGDS